MIRTTRVRVATLTPQHGAGRRRERGVGLRDGILGGHQHRAAAGVLQRQHRRPADQLGADDDGAAARHLRCCEVHQVLQVPGGVDARGAVAGDQPGGARPLPGAGGQDDGTRLDELAALRRGDLQGALRGPAGDHGLGADLRPGRRRALRRAGARRPGR